MGNSVRNADLVNKTEIIAKALQEYFGSFFISKSSLLNPAQTYSDANEKDKLKASHAALDMFVKSLSWQRNRANTVIRELREFDAMLTDSKSELSEPILENLGNSWSSFNSESTHDVKALIYYFSESLTAAIYWSLSGTDRDKLVAMLSNE